MNTTTNIKIILRLTTVLIALFSFNISAQYNANAVKAYIQKYSHLALENEKNYGVPAPITLAQAILESRAGASTLARASNNHFGIKKHNWKGKVYYAQDDEPHKSAFRCYSSPEESYRAHAEFLRREPRYSKLFNISTYNYREWAFGLQRAGYATATDYATALIGLIDYYELYAVNGGAKLHRGKQNRKQISRTVEHIEEELAVDDYSIIPEIDESEEEASFILAMRNYPVEINDIPCVVIMPGEELTHIAADYNISIEQILDYNEISSPSQLHSGDIIFLDKKKKKYHGAQDNYTARDGETLYSVSQQYGIQLRRLAKLNGLNESTYLEKGACLKLK